jgi:hypothetical protein
MAAKKPTAKPKAKAEKAFEPSIEIEPEPKQINLPFTAAQLAEMGRKFKVGLLGKVFVTDAHNAYLNAVSKGAEASKADVKFVNGHLEVIKGWNH